MRGWVIEQVDRLLASDPGLGRLRMAVSATVAVGSTLAVEFGLAELLGSSAPQRLVTMLVGAVVAMMGSMALSGTGVLRKAKVAVFFPVAIGLGMLAGVAVGSHTDTMLAVFVLIMFGAVYVRRFGMPFFFFGFLAWMGYFLASFMHAALALLPHLVLAVVVATAWLFVLSITVLRTNPERTLRRTLRAYDARARAVARAAAELLESGPDEPRRQARWRRRIAARQAGMAEAALMVEGWSEEAGALPPGWSGPALRRRLIDTQQVLDRLASSAIALAENSGPLRDSGRVAMAHLARREDARARVAARRLGVHAHQGQLQDAEGWWPARHLAIAALEFLDAARAAGNPPQVQALDDYTATASLALGNLPGAPSVAKGVPARGGRWNPFARLDLTSRQAVQVAVAGALAILLGRQLSPTRYYWAVIAAFVVFTGTATRSDTFVKGANRVAGTVLGLFASIVVANLTVGHSWLVLAVILGSVLCGFYLVRLTYAGMIFFITIMVGQLYTVLHEFSDQLLVLRLEETAVGAAVGILVALVVTPLSTSDTVRSARDNLLNALADLLDAVSTQVTDPSAARDLDAASRTLDNRARELALVAKPLTGRGLWSSRNPQARRRVGLYLATASHARALTVGLRHGDERRHPHATASAARALSGAARLLTGVAPGRPMPSLSEPLEEADAALFDDGSISTADRATDATLVPLLHLHAVLTDLAVAPAEVSAAPPTGAPAAA